MELLTKLFKTNVNNKKARRLLWSILPMQILSFVCLNLPVLADNLLVGNLLEKEYYACFALIAPINYIYYGMSCIVAMGAILLCSKALIRSNREELSKILYHACLMVVILAIVIGVINIVFANEIVNILGVGSINKSLEAVSAFNPTYLIYYSTSYLKGISYGLIFMMLIPVLVTFLQYENDSIGAIISSLVMLGSKIGFDLLAIYNFKNHMLGLGLSTSLSCLISLGFIITRYLLNKGLIKPKFDKIDLKVASSIIKSGLFSELGSICLMISYIFINNISIYVVGAYGVVVTSIILSIGYISGVALIKSGAKVIEVASLYMIKEEDKDSLIRIIRNTIISVGVINLIIAVLLIVFAPSIVSLFGIKDYNYLSDGLIHYAISFVIGIIPYYWLLIQKTLKRNKLSYYYAIAINLVVKILVVIILSLIGEKAIHYVYWVVDLLGIIAIPIISLKLNDTRIRSLDDVLDLPKDFGILNEDRIDINVKTMDEVLSVSNTILEFTKNKKINEKKAYYCSLALEEVAGNFISNSKEKKNKSLDLRISVKNDKVILRIKDNYVHFNPIDKYQYLDYEVDFKNIGIRALIKNASEISYASTYNLNVVTIIY